METSTWFARCLGAKARNNQVGCTWKTAFYTPVAGLALLLLSSASTAASTTENQTLANHSGTDWILSIDNDGGGVSDDQNYTGGLALTLSGPHIRQYPLTLDPVLGAINRFLFIDQLYPNENEHRFDTFQLGLAAFTPDAITVREPIPNDHPYACLALVSNSRTRVFATQGVSYQTTLMVGVLGTALCKNIQQTTHQITGSSRPRGWDNQISDGGEPTARWSITRQQPLYLSPSTSNRFRSELTFNIKAAVGLNTHAGVGMSLRYGRIHTPWWKAAPHQSEYVAVGVPNLPSTTRTRHGHNRYVFIGAMVRYRFYNGLLQGQFRDSNSRLKRC